MTDEEAARVQEAIESAPVLRVADPVLSNAELSECIGDLTLRIERIGKVVDALAAKQSRPSLKKQIKQRIVKWLSE